MACLLFNLQEEASKKRRGKSKPKRINEPSHIVLFLLLLGKKNLGEKEEVRGECLEKEPLISGCKFHKTLTSLHGNQAVIGRRKIPPSHHFLVVHGSALVLLAKVTPCSRSPLPRSGDAVALLARVHAVCVTASGVL